MSSTSPLSFSTFAIPRDRHTRVVKAQIIIHILVLSTAILLLMQLISHTAAVEEIEDFEMPPSWREMFVRQLIDGTEVVSWVAVYLFVLLDGLHALLCVGCYTDQLHPVRRRRHVGRRRRATKAWFDGMRRSLEAWRQRHVRSFGTGDEEEHSRVPAHDTECWSKSPPSSPQNHTSSHCLEKSDIAPSPLSPLDPHTYHPLLHPAYTSLIRHILLILWDTIMLLTLSSHIYVYTGNISPSLAFCDQHDYPFWHFHEPAYTLQQRCIRINWSIHSAGGCSATGAVVLALWHFCALVCRLWGVADERLLGKVRGRTLTRFKSKLRTKRKGADERGGIGMLAWQYPPRDVDVRSRSTRISVRSGTGTGMEVASRHLPTVSQEEMGIGLGRRRKWRREGSSDASSDSGRGKGARSSWWSWRSEGFFECLA